MSKRGSRRQAASLKIPTVTGKKKWYHLCWHNFILATASPVSLSFGPRVGKKRINHNRPKRTGARGGITSSEGRKWWENAAQKAPVCCGNTAEVFPYMSMGARGMDEVDGSCSASPSWLTSCASEGERGTETSSLGQPANLPAAHVSLFVLKRVLVYGWDEE